MSAADYCWQNIQLVKYREIAVISLATTNGYEVITSEHRRHSALTGEGAANLPTDVPIALRIRKMKTRNC